MNKKLKHVIAELVRLPEDEQESIANLILEEMASEHGWNERFTNSEDKLAELGRRARDQHARGETTPLNFPPKR